MLDLRQLVSRDVREWLTTELGTVDAFMAHVTELVGHSAFAAHRVKTHVLSVGNHSVDLRFIPEGDVGANYKGTRIPVQSLGTICIPYLVPDVTEGSKRILSILLPRLDKDGEVVFNVQDATKVVVQNVLDYFGGITRPLGGNCRLVAHLGANSLSTFVPNLKFGLFVHTPLSASLLSGMRGSESFNITALVEEHLALNKPLMEASLGEVLTQRLAAAAGSKLAVDSDDAPAGVVARVRYQELAALSMNWKEESIHPIQAIQTAARECMKALRKAGVHLFMTDGAEIKACVQIPDLAKGSVIPAPGKACVAVKNVPLTPMVEEANPPEIDGVTLRHFYGGTLAILPTQGTLGTNWNPVNQRGWMSASFAETLTGLERVKTVVYLCDRTVDGVVKPAIDIKVQSGHLSITAAQILEAYEFSTIQGAEEDGATDDLRNMVAPLIGSRLPLQRGRLRIGSGPNQGSIPEDGRVFNFKGARSVTITNASLEVVKRGELREIRLHLEMELVFPFRTDDKTILVGPEGKATWTVLPDSQMPKLPDGKAVDMVLDAAKHTKTKNGIPKVLWQLAMCNHGGKWHFGEVPKFATCANPALAAKQLSRLLGREIPNPFMDLTFNGETIHAVVIPARLMRPAKNIAARMEMPAEVKEQIASMFGSSSQALRELAAIRLVKSRPMFEAVQAVLWGTYKVSWKDGHAVVSWNGKEYVPEMILRPVRRMINGVTVDTSPSQTGLDLAPLSEQTTGYEINPDTMGWNRNRVTGGNPTPLAEGTLDHTILGPNVKAGGMIIFQTPTNLNAPLVKDGAFAWKSDRTGSIPMGVKGISSTNGGEFQVTDTHPFLWIPPEFCRGLEQEGRAFHAETGELIHQLTQYGKALDDFAFAAMKPRCPEGSFASAIYGVDGVPATRCYSGKLLEDSYRALIGSLSIKTYVGFDGKSHTKSEPLPGLVLAKALGKKGLIYQSVNAPTKGHRFTLNCHPLVGVNEVMFSAKHLDWCEANEQKHGRSKAIEMARRANLFHVVRGEVILMNRWPKTSGWGAYVALTVTEAPGWLGIVDGHSLCLSYWTALLMMTGDCDGDNINAVHLSEYVKRTLRNTPWEDETFVQYYCNRLSTELRPSVVFDQYTSWSNEDRTVWEEARKEPRWVGFTQEERKATWVSYAPLAAGHKDWTGLSMSLEDQELASYQMCSLKLMIGAGANVGLKGALKWPLRNCPILWQLVHEYAIDKRQQLTGKAWLLWQVARGNEVEGDVNALLKEACAEVFDESVVEKATAMALEEYAWIKANTEAFSMARNTVLQNMGLTVTEAMSYNGHEVLAVLRRPDTLNEAIAEAFKIAGISDDHPICQWHQ